MAEQRTIDNVVQGMYADIRPQQEAQYEYFNQLARRLGLPQSQQFASQIAAPYSEKAAQAAGSQAMNAAQLDERQRQFNEQLAESQKQFQQGQQNWEKQFNEYSKQQNLANMMAMMQYTGWTPDLLKSLGYGDLGRSDMRNTGRQVQDLGFQSPMQQQQNQQGNMYPSILNQANNWGGKTGLIYG